MVEKVIRIAFIIAILFSKFAIAQNTLDAFVGDNVDLRIDAVRGSIQWQRSYDQATWNDLPSATTSTLTTAITALPVHFRARVTDGTCEPVYTEIISFRQSTAKLWSDPATWNGHKPQANETVTIPEGLEVLLDESPPALGGLNIHGTLEFARKNLALTATYIMVHGTLRIGSEAAPFMQNATLTLNGANVNESIMDMGTRGIMVMGGTLELHGKPVTTPWTKINQHATKGATTIELIKQVDWKNGDEIVIAPTDYYLAATNQSVSQKVTVTAMNGKQITFSAGLNAFRWGLLQYATTNGMSLSPIGMVTPPAPDTQEKSTPTILDERAEVGNLTRNIVIQAPTDALWNTQGFGVHVMVMGPSSTAHVEGVEIRRGGQRGRLARYAFHFHQMSYAGTNTLADAAGQYFRSSTINTSANRGIVIHGTNGVTIKDNVIYDVRGHGIFTEDAVERRNVFDGNLVLRVRNPTQPLKLHESDDENEGGSSGFWISNPDNTITNNVAADCKGNGFWLPFPEKPFGLNASVVDTRDGQLLNPSRLLFGIFNNNTAHSNGMNGILLDDVEVDNNGTTFPLQYFSTSNGRDPSWPNATLRRFKLTNYKVWKNLDNGIWDRATWPDNYGVVNADNCGRFFAGAGQDGIIERSLVVGTSLNHLMNGTARPASADFSAGHSSSSPSAFATYHSTFDIQNNIVINFPAVAMVRSGVFATDDYYTRPVEKGQKRNSGNMIIQSHPGVRLAPPYNWFTLASALWDYYGLWGPAENYLVYNVPFLTFGKTITQVPAGLSVAGAVSVPGPFFGFEGFVLHGVGDTPPQNQPYFDLMGIQVKRYDASMNTVGTWTVQQASPDALLQHMRHFAASPDGIYELTFPQEAIRPTNFQMNVENMLNTSDQVVIGIEFDGNINAKVRMRSYDRYEPYQSVASLDAVRQSSGATFWQDKTNNRVWVKIRGGFWQFWTNNTQLAVPSGDDLLYEPTTLQIRP